MLQDGGGPRTLGGRMVRPRAARRMGTDPRAAGADQEPHRRDAAEERTGAASHLGGEPDQPDSRAGRGVRDQAGAVDGAGHADDADGRDGRDQAEHRAAEAGKESPKAGVRRTPRDGQIADYSQRFGFNVYVSLLSNQPCMMSNASKEALNAFARSDSTASVSMQFCQLVRSGHPSRCPSTSRPKLIQCGSPLPTLRNKTVPSGKCTA